MGFRARRWLAGILFAGGWLLPGQSLAEFEKKVTEFTLPNGLHFIVVRRPEAPVVSFHTYVNAGSVNDPAGQTGIAHMMEHMAFKGTERIGTKNWPAEKRAQEQIEKAYDALLQEKFKGAKADAKRVQAREAALKDAIASADAFVVNNEYDRLIESEGGVGLNAGTGMDSTNYYLAFPANRLELWFLLESERFFRPVFREFYKERDVVREERRQRVESSSQGLLVEALIATAFQAHPYKNMPGGWASDIENYRMPEAWAFFKKHYVPSNMTIGIAGDVDPAQVRRLADQYFGRIPAAPLPEPVRTVEPVQLGERRVKVQHKDQPILIVGYKRPDRTHPDDAVFDVIADLLSGGRTGMLYTDLVRDRQLALVAAAQPSFPGDKYPNLFLLYAVPNLGKTVEENERALYENLEKLKTGPVEPAALERVKTKLRAALIRKLDSNGGLAAELTAYHVAFGSWKRMFTEIEEMKKINAADVQRVAREYFVAERRTVGWTYQPAENKPESKKEGQQ
jgi:predicted Zn-dependent peptidase